MKVAVLPPGELRRVLGEDLPKAFEGLEWYPLDDVYFITFAATMADRHSDRYLTKWTFLHYPDQPPHVTFVNPESQQYDGTGWPNASSPTTSLHPVYDGAPEGLICNSMFYDWYYYGGHGSQPAVSWIPGVHKAIASVTELRQVLNPPNYRGRL